MQFPLTEDMFLTLDPTKNIDRGFLNAFIRAVNKWYEEGKRAERSRFCVTADVLATVYERIYQEKPEGETMLFDVTAEYMSAAWQQGLRDSGAVFDMPLEVIQIYPCFTEHPPKADKVEQKVEYFKETELLQSPIILNSDNFLIDGFTSYLLAKQSDIKCVPVRYGIRQIVRACHKKGGQLYDWELPEYLIDKVFVGDKVLVHTRHGVRFVTVAAVEPYRPQEQKKALRKVIRVKRKAKYK